MTQTMAAGTRMTGSHEASVRTQPEGTLSRHGACTSASTELCPELQGPGTQVNNHVPPYGLSLCQRSDPQPLASQALCSLGSAAATCGPAQTEESSPREPPEALLTGVAPGLGPAACPLFSLPPRV